MTAVDLGRNRAIAAEALDGEPLAVVDDLMPGDLDEPEYLAAERSDAHLELAAVESGDVGPIGNPLLEQLDAATYVGDAIKDIPPPAPLIGGILNLDSLAVLYGPSGEHKSFLAIDWALHVVTGSWWNGREVQRGPVVYIAAEGGSGVGIRVDAWERHHRLHGGLEGFEPLHWLPREVNLFDAGWTGALVEYCAVRRPVLVVLDTLARNIVGAEENSAKDIGIVIHHADLIRKATGACVLAVHHSGKDLAAGSRGSSALRGALDTEIECSATDTRTTVKIGKQKDAAKANSVTLERIAVGESCVLVPAGVVLDDGHLTPRQQEALDALRRIEVPGGIAPTIWLKSSDLRERTFYDALSRLLKNALIHNIGTDDRPRYITTDTPAHDEGEPF